MLSQIESGCIVWLLSSNDIFYQMPNLSPMEQRPAHCAATIWSISIFISRLCRANRSKIMRMVSYSVSFYVLHTTWFLVFIIHICFLINVPFLVQGTEVKVLMLYIVSSKSISFYHYGGCHGEKLFPFSLLSCTFSIASWIYCFCRRNGWWVWAVGIRGSPTQYVKISIINVVTASVLIILVK